MPKLILEEISLFYGLQVSVNFLCNLDLKIALKRSFNVNWTIWYLLNNVLFLFDVATLFWKLYETS